MSIIAWIVLGLISGFIANKIMDKFGGDLVFDLGLGVFGAIAGGYAISVIGQQAISTFNLWSALVSVVGATIVLVIHHVVSVRRAAAR